MAISVVQSKSGSAITAGSVTVTLNSATTAGNCLVVCVGSDGGTVSSITLGGSAGNFAKAINVTNGGTDCEIWTDQNCAGGQTSVVVTNSSGFVDIGVTVYEISGLLTSAAVDKTSTGTGTGSPWSSGTTATTTQASEIFVGALFVNSTSVPTITPPSSPWVNTSVTANNRPLESGTNIVSSTGTATYNGTITGTNAYACVVVTLKGVASAGPAGTVQPQATVPVPRRRPVRGLWQRITGQAFVQVPAPVQQPRPAPRRRLARAWIQFTPVTTANAPPPPPPAGTVQPPATIQTPRRRLGRGISRGVAVPGIQGKAPAQQYRTPPRKRLSRAWTRFTPVKTTNAPLTRTLLISLASQAGTDDYGNSYPQGILATAGVIEGPTIIGSDAFFYSPSPGFGNLTQTIAEASGTDQYGNAYLAGTTTYTNDGSFWSAVQVYFGVVAWYEASGPGGPWTEEAAIGFSFNNVTGGGLTFSAPAGISGALNIPQAGVSGSIASLPQDTNSGTSWASGERAFMNNNWVNNVNQNFAIIISALQSAGIIT